MSPPHQESSHPQECHPQQQHAGGRRPSWIQRQSLCLLSSTNNTTTAPAAVTDPASWPPHNGQLDYDWNLPTVEFYKQQPPPCNEGGGDDDDDAPPAATTNVSSQSSLSLSLSLFAPTFAPARQKLDYSYHHHLILTRQLLQDAILQRVVEDDKDQEEEPAVNIVPPKQPPPQRPWIVFTAGPMGVGKGYVLTQLHQQDLFPHFQDYVKIDPDHIKAELPEMPGFLQVDRETAATKLHRESTQMADILLEHALAHGRSILVDGSLRDVQYYQQLLQTIRRDHPNYRIALLHVTASRATILERAAERGRRTGRVVPTQLLHDSLDQVPQSVQQLTPWVDAVHTIANPNQQPLQLVSSQINIQQQQQCTVNIDGNETNNVDEVTNPGSTWDDFRRSWLDDNHDDTAEAATAAAADDNKNCCLPHFDIHTLWQCPVSHAAAQALWGRAYPNLCPRCTLSCDGVCGLCLHGTHQCACDICR